MSVIPDNAFGDRVRRRLRDAELIWFTTTSADGTPQPNPVWPSYARCVDVKPAKTTTYTLTIDDGAGNTKTQALEVKVQ